MIPSNPAPRPYFGGPSVHTLRIELLGVEPTVWRRLMVPGETKLPRFNRLLETVMGWEGYHLHMFEVGDLRFGPPDEDDDDVIDERRVTVKQILPCVGSQLRWAYDFGDNWRHDIVVEAIEAPSPDVRAPTCTAGERACPPEDCGGVGGYAELRAALANPAHADHNSMREWAGEAFDPDLFDSAAATERLGRV